MSIAGVGLSTPKGRMRLKWHMLRDRADRPPHSRTGLATGLAAGALLEVDLQPTADGHWICLHDDTLDAETDGKGRVDAQPRARLEELRQHDGEPLLFLDELAHRVASAQTGRVQLDVKHGSDDPAALARFEAALAAHGDRFDIGGHDWSAVRRLGELAPGIRAGWDPSDRLPELPVGDWCGLIAGVPAAEAPMLYLSHETVTRAHASGIDLIGFAAGRGQDVDCWTVDPSLPGAADLLRLLARLGCRQITTNDPIALEALWRSLS